MFTGSLADTFTVSLQHIEELWVVSCNDTHTAGADRAMGC